VSWCARVRATGCQVREEDVYVELCDAVMLSFAAENEARMTAMIAARSNVELPPAAYRLQRSSSADTRAM
jgi:hypothetical protein